MGFWRFYAGAMRYRDGGGLTAEGRVRRERVRAVRGSYSVGMRHHPLAEILNGFAAAGLVIERVAESGPRPVPITLAIRARKPS